MDLGLQGKTALVTGGAQGIGSAITRELAQNGAQVVFTTRDATAIRGQIDSLGEYASQCSGIQCQLMEPGGVASLGNELRQKNLSVDILVNNAGHTLNIKDPYCSMDDWRRVFRLNFEAAVELTNMLVPAMKERHWGRIVNITSCAGLENSGPVTFSVAKAALTAYTRSMGRVLAMEEPGIVMSAVFPGVVLTKGGHWEKVLSTDPRHAEQYLKERCPLGRFGHIEEISPVVAFYCSEKASFSHGAIVPVDAGQSKHFMSFNYMD
jgi:NAD(P)-dependent dehydrogenase (short-subunit alcohol dehydrogenase family)